MTVITAESTSHPTYLTDSALRMRAVSARRSVSHSITESEAVLFPLAARSTGILVNQLEIRSSRLNQLSQKGIPPLTVFSNDIAAFGEAGSSRLLQHLGRPIDGDDQ